MGTDIHAYIEVDWGSEPEPFTGDRAVSFSAGELSIARDYLLFAALAGVRRRMPWLGDREKTPLHPPRGLPGSASLDVMEQYNEEANGADGEFIWRPNPDWHTPSWLFRDEVFATLDYDRLAVADLDLTFRVVLDVMANFDQHLGPRRSRLVFWFDN